MGIDPVHSPHLGGSTRADTTAAGAPQESAPDAVRGGVRQHTDSGGQGDSVELSTASLALHAQAGVTGGAPPPGTMPAEQMRAVIGHVMSGRYDQPDAREATATGIARELGMDGRLA